MLCSRRLHRTRLSFDLERTIVFPLSGAMLPGHIAIPMHELGVIIGRPHSLGEVGGNRPEFRILSARLSIKWLASTLSLWIPSMICSSFDTSQASAAVSHFIRYSTHPPSGVSRYCPMSESFLLVLTMRAFCAGIRSGASVL